MLFLVITKNIMNRCIRDDNYYIISIIVIYASISERENYNWRDMDNFSAGRCSVDRFYWKYNISPFTDTR